MKIKCVYYPLKRIFFMLLLNDKQELYQHTPKNISPFTHLCFQRRDTESRNKKMKILCIQISKHYFDLPICAGKYTHFPCYLCGFKKVNRYAKFLFEN